MWYWYLKIVDEVELKKKDLGNIEKRYGWNKKDVEKFEDFFWKVKIGDSSG